MRSSRSSEQLIGYSDRQVEMIEVTQERRDAVKTVLDETG
jgi:hypothetical protein